MKFLRGNQTRFINKELRKVIYDRSRLRKRSFKTPAEKMTSYIKNKEINVSQFGRKVLEIFLTKLQMKT